MAARRSWLGRIVGIVLAAIVLLVVGVGVLLGAAHRQIRAIDPPLPSLDALRAFASDADLPVRISYWNTASQPAPRSSVLEPKRDPDPSQPYVMSHPSFVLEWADGRTLLVDAGMDEAQAVAFGEPIRVLGAGAVEAHGSVAEHVLPALGERPLAIAFTHLHTDHVGGIVGLCQARRAPASVRLVQTTAQAELVNYTTRPGRALVDAATCLVHEPLADAPARPIPALPGAFVVHAAGHTPDSEIVGAWVRGADGPRGYLLAGDAANAIDGIRRDVPKPWAYQTFLVPESEDRLRRVRAWLRDAEQQGWVVAIAHDQRHLESTGIPRFGD
jgi:glyoxylase-like metal-dependent hydrolase (beta-lactamase superfamily II)